MNIVYIQTYPTYHDGISSRTWLSIENRDKWMPGITAGQGHDVELWGIGDTESVQELPVFAYNWEGGTQVTIRLFEADSYRGASKKHTSTQLLAHARKQKTDLYVLKGLDGGLGLQLIREHLLPNNIPFVFVVGGEFYSKYSRHARAVLYETDRQLEWLMRLRDGDGFLGTIRHMLGLARKAGADPAEANFPPRIGTTAYIRLAKSVDTDKFRPHPEIEKTYDIMAMGRLIPYYKDYSALKMLASAYRIGFIGGGPLLEEFRRDMPGIDWLGAVPHDQVPEFLARGRTFFHTSLRDHFPRVIPEAAACGLPVFAFGEAIRPDVLPDGIGVRLSGREFATEIGDLLGNPAQIAEKAGQARAYALNNWGKHSSETAIRTMLEIM